MALILALGGERQRNQELKAILCHITNGGQPGLYEYLCKNEQQGPCKVAQWGKALVTYLSLIPGSHMIERRDNSRVSSDVHIHTMAHICSATMHMIN